jgi:hypothetical protein
MNGFSTYSEAEIQRWLHLRAIEWSGWPAFVSQPIVPILLIVGKWPAAIGSCIYLGVQRHYVLAIVALLWPFLAGFVSAPARLFFGLIGIPRQIGKVELALAKQIGYVK